MLCGPPSWGPQGWACDPGCTHTLSPAAFLLPRGEIHPSLSTTQKADVPQSLWKVMMKLDKQGRLQATGAALGHGHGTQESRGALCVSAAKGDKEDDLLAGKVTTVRM